MVDREALVQTAIGVAGSLMLLGFVVVGAGGAGGTGGTDGAVVVGGIAAFIVFLTLAGYWLSRS